MLRDVGCQFVIIGHSERRHTFGETDLLINRKVRAAIAVGLDVILCIGETLDERNQDATERVLSWQLKAGLHEFPTSESRRLVIAYEPVWAIGTGVNATPEQAQQAHLFIRNEIAGLLDRSIADNMVIQYGGSAKPENVASLLAQQDVDGALVGGASLKAELFLAIVKIAQG
jgi:triosephosphate isomerase